MQSGEQRRLALVERDVEVPKGAEAELILPTKAVNELLRLLGDKGDVKLSVGENQIIINFDGTTLCSKLIEGTYPNFRQVIPYHLVEPHGHRSETTSARAPSNSDPLRCGGKCR